MKRPRYSEELSTTLPSLSLASPVSLDNIDFQLPSGSMSGSACYEGKRGETEPPHAKIASLSCDPAATDSEAEPAIMTCLLHREHVEFPSYEAYEIHYNKEHLNRCIECRRNFPSPLYLSLHSDEWHDPFVAVKREKGEHTYACFVEGCERKCGSMDKRRRHLIDKHSFPKNFFFLITQFGTDGRHSLLDDGGRRWQHRRWSSTGNTAKKESRRRVANVTMPGANETAKGPLTPSDGNKDHSEGSRDPDIVSNPKQQKSDPPVEIEEPDVQMDDLAGSMSTMTFIPRSVRFGRGGGFAGLAR